MSENFNKDISELKNLGLNGIDMDQWGEQDDSEMKQVTDILNKIKKSADSGTLKAEQLKKVISFLDRQISENMSISHKGALIGMKKEFVNLTEKYNSEKAAIIKEAKTNKGTQKKASKTPKKSIETHEDYPLKADGHYTKEEISFVRENYEKVSDGTEQDKLLKGDFDNFINKDIKMASEVEIVKNEAVMNKIIAKLKTDFPAKYTILESKGAIDSAGNFKNTAKNGILVMQVTLNQLGRNTGSADGIYGPNTFKGVLNWQENSTTYKAEELNGEGGKSDAISNGRTMMALCKEIGACGEVKPEPIPEPPKPTPVEEEKITETIPYVDKKKEGLQHDNTEVGTRLNTPENTIEKIKKEAPALSIMIDIAEVWIDAAQKESSSEMAEWIKIGKTDGEVLKEQASKVANAISALINKVQNDENVDYSEIRNIFSMMDVAEKEETVMSNLNEIRTQLGFVDNTNYAEKKLVILDLMRVKAGGITEGNSALVISKLGDMLLDKPDFKDIQKIINDDNTYALIESGDIDGLKVLGIPEDLAEDLSENYGKVHRLQLQNKDLYKEAVEKEFPGITNPILKNKLIKEKIDLSTKLSIKDLLKNGLLFEKLDGDENLENKDKENKIYSDAVGVGVFTFSDENVANSVEIGLILATSFIPLGAGIRAAGYAGKVVQSAYASKRIVQAIETGGIIGRGLKISKPGLTIAAEGLAFYETSNLLHNAMFAKHYSNLLDGAGNTTEIAKSIAFFGVMKGFSKVLGSKKIADLKGMVPKSVIEKTPQILKASGLIGTEALAVYATGNELEKILSPENDTEYTWEGYIEALMLVGGSKFLLKGGAKPKAEKLLKIEDAKLQKVKGTSNQFVDKNGQYWIEKSPKYYVKGISPELHKIKNSSNSKVKKGEPKQIEYKTEKVKGTSNPKIDLKLEKTNYNIKRKKLATKLSKETNPEKQKIIKQELRELRKSIDGTIKKNTIIEKNKIKGPKIESVKIQNKVLSEVDNIRIDNLKIVGKRVKLEDGKTIIKTNSHGGFKIEKGETFKSHKELKNFLVKERVKFLETNPNKLEARNLLRNGKETIIKGEIYQGKKYKYLKIGKSEYYNINTGKTVNSIPKNAKPIEN